MACSGSAPTFSGNITITSNNCTNSITVTVDAPCGSSGYFIVLSRGLAPNAAPTPGNNVGSIQIPDGPVSGFSHTFVDTPPCGRGVWEYQAGVACGANGFPINSSNVVSSAAQGGAASITFNSITRDANCLVTATVQISKPCGECAGTVELTRNGNVIFTAVVPQGQLIGFQASTTDTPPTGSWSYQWRVKNDGGIIDATGTLTVIVSDCFTYNPFTTPLPAGQMEKHIVLVQVSKVAGNYVYTDIKELELNEQRMEWWYHKNGGCGAFRLLTHNDYFTNVIDTALPDSWELHVRIKMAGEFIHTTWYRGLIRSIRTEEQGAEQFTEVRGYGYVELLDNVIVQRKYPAGMQVDAIVNDIVDNWIKPNTRIRRPADVDVTNGGSGVDASTYVTSNEIHFECSALKALKFLAELQGSREFGVDARGAIYFRANISTVIKNFYLSNDIIQRVAGGKTFIQGNDVKVGGKAFGSVNYLQNRQDVTDITANGLYESAAEVPWVTGDKDASVWADNIIAKNKVSQLWSVFTWKNVIQNLTVSNPIGKIQVFGSDMSNDVVTYDIAKIQYIEGGWITKQEIREMGSSTFQSQLDQQLLKATIYAGFYPRDLTEEIEVRLREQIEFLKGKNRQFRYPNDVTNLPLTGHIPGELIHWRPAVDVTNYDMTNNPTELQDITNPRGVIATWLDKQWTKLSLRRTFNVLPTRGKYIGEVVSLITDMTNQQFGELRLWTGTQWVTITGGGSGVNANPVTEGARVTNSVNTTISGPVVLTYDTILANDNGLFGAAGTSRIAIKTNGWHIVAGGVLWGQGINGTYRALSIRKNGTTIIKTNRRDDFEHNQTRTNEVEEVILLLAGDYLELIADTDAVDGGDIASTASPYSPLFSVSLITGGGTFSSAGGNPTGPAGGDLYDPTATYPSPKVSGLQGDPLATKISDGFIKRNFANTAWLDVTYGDIAHELERGGKAPVRIDQWDVATDNQFCDVTLSAHGLLPKLDGNEDDVFFGDGRWKRVYNPYMKEIIGNPYTQAPPVTAIIGTGSATTTVTGTGSDFFDTDNKYWIKWTTGASNGNRGGWFPPSSNRTVPLKSLKENFMAMRTGQNANDLTNIRIWIAMSDTSGSIIGTDSPSGDSTVGFRFSTGAGDTTWQCFANDASGVGTFANSGIAVALNTEYRFYILKNSQTQVKYYINEVLVATITTHVPNAGAPASWEFEIQTLENAAKTFATARCYAQYL